MKRTAAPKSIKKSVLKNSPIGKGSMGRRYNLPLYIKNHSKKTNPTACAPSLVINGVKLVPTTYFTGFGGTALHGFKWGCNFGIGHLGFATLNDAWIKVIKQNISQMVVFHGDFNPMVQENCNTPPEHTPGNPPSQL